MLIVRKFRRIVTTQRDMSDNIHKENMFKSSPSKVLISFERVALIIIRTNELISGKLRKNYFEYLFSW